MNFTFYNPVKLLVGKGNFSKLGEEAKNHGKKALLVVSPSARSGELAKKAAVILQESGVEAVVFNNVVANPMGSSVREGADLAAKEKCDMVIGFGGGSIMDTAKGIAFLTNKEGDIFEYIMGERTGTDSLPNIQITTTAGTGSEANWTAVFTNDKNLEKKGLVTPLIYPKVSIIDPELMLSLPSNLISGPGLDALFHAFESYISKNANPMSEMYSLQAMELSIENLPKVYNNPTDIDAWEKVALANTLAGIAIGCAGTTIPHAMGHPLSGHLNASHPDSLVAVYMPFMKFTAPHATKKFAKLAQMLGCDTANMSEQEAANSSIKAMDEFIGNLNAHKTLRDLGVTADMLDKLADISSASMARVLANNPIVPTRDQVREMYAQCL